MSEPARRAKAEPGSFASRTLARSESVLVEIAARTSPLDPALSPWILAAGVLAATMFLAPQVVQQGPDNGAGILTIMGLGISFGVAASFLVSAACAGAAAILGYARDALDATKGGQDAL